ncbi:MULTISPECIES: DUF6069 family protein [Thermomonospora]|uniref:Uncharacterized protein n=1 Tax=Thermomonospora curvata (strain ATCC 19995 / DSM 43183 / JCM 3096 / KCTC 9072 / NBRC 15933 / NCIMB 10081 / Henssen B9) TaxID=471852 RepID=D1ABK5_THECD|nr:MULTISPECIES: DUF6069 family protein [Thermomonospora]ACY97241.1 hypothetical protein Tcur_1665 [Thermomonospora curvata DSM 43183]
MPKVPFGSHPGGGPGPRAHPLGRSRPPLIGSYRCPATVARPRPEPVAERYRGFAALHSALAAGPEIRLGRLWAGGAVAAVCAAMVTVLGGLVARGLLEVAVPAPVSPQADGAVVGLVYALCAVALTLQATGLLQVLMTVSARPVRALVWICGAGTGVAALLPLVVRADPQARLATAAIHLTAGIVVIAVLAVTASLAARWPGPPGLDPGR